MKLVAAIAAVIALISVPASAKTASASTLARCGSYPPFRPDLRLIRAENMPCWSAKLLLDEALTQQITSRRLLEIVGFVCTYRPQNRTTGRLICASGAQIARGTYRSYIVVD